jgi:hypothetical protein
MVYIPCTATGPLCQTQFLMMTLSQDGNRAHHMDVSISEMDHVSLLIWIQARQGKQIVPRGTKTQPSKQPTDQNAWKSQQEG